MIRPFVVFLGVILCALEMRFSYGQNSNPDHYSMINVAIPPAPEAAALGKFIETPVGLYTGVPGINIPLYELRGRNLSVPISLSYHAGGIRVDESASRVGLGWAISAGGMISRTLRGKKDEDAFGYLNIAMQIPTMAGSGSHPVNALAYTASEYYFLEDMAQGKKDGEPDMFSISVPGFSAKFFFDPNGIVQTVPYQPIDLQIDWVNHRWILRLTNGTAYYFGGDGATELTSTQLNSAGGMSGSLPWISSWMLTRMESPNGDQIRFEYESTGVYSETMTESRTQYHGTTVSGYCSAPADQVGTGYHERNLVRLKRMYSLHGSVDFVYEDVQRLDVSGDYALKSVEVLDQSETVIKKFVLGHSYWSNRLMLNEVTELRDDCERKPPYRFTYDKEHALPSRGSFSQDFWGFFNGKTNLSLVPLTKVGVIQGNVCQMLGDANREPDFEYGKSGVLTTLQYPTGAQTQFEYEGHDFFADANDPGQRVMDSKYAHAWCTGANCVSQACGNCNASDSIPFRVDFEQCVKLSYWMNSANNECGGEIKVLDSLGNDVFTHSCNSLSAYTGELYLSLPAGNYTLLATGTFAGDDAQAWVYFEKYQDAPDGIRDLGGLRVRKIVEHDPDHPQNDRIREFVYRLESSPAVSSGEIASFPDHFQHVYREKRAVPNSSQTWYVTCSFVSVSSSQVSMPAYTQGSHVGYKEVTVLDGAAGANGKTVTSFSCFSDYGDGLNEFPFGAVSSLDHQRGQHLQAKVYDNQGKLKTETLNDYSFAVGGNSSTQFGYKVGYSLRNIESNGAFVHDLICRPYEIHSSWQYLSKTRNRIYAENGIDYLETEEEYLYDSANHPFLTGKKTADSEGRTHIQEFSYPQDFGSAGSDSVSQALDRMKNDLFMLSPVIETCNYVEESPGQKKLLSSVLKVFKVWNKGMVLPEKLYQFQTETPQTNFTKATISNGQFTRDSRYRLLEEVQAYDECGNLTQALKINGLRSAFQYEYGSALPTLKAVDAEIRRPDRFQGRLERIRCKGENVSGAPFFCNQAGSQNNWWPESTVATPLGNGNFEVVSTWVRERKITSCSGQTPQSPTGTQWTLAENACAFNGKATYVREPQDQRAGADNYGIAVSSLSFESGNESSSDPNNDFWSFSSNNTHDADAHSGAFSRKVLSGTYGPTRDFRPNDQEDRFHLSAWVKIDPYAAGGKLVIHSKSDQATVHSVYPGATLYDSYVAVNLPATGEWERVEAVLDLKSLRQAAGIPSGTLLRLRCFIDNNTGSGDILVDDLRFQAGKSRVETYVFDPMMGLKAQADANDRYAFYEYDGLQRLRLIRDDEQNIRKKLSYNYGDQGTSAEIDLSPGSNVYVNDAVTLSGNFFTPCMSHPAVEYRWDFGDGNTQSGPNASTQHSYGFPGVYTVELEVEDNRGFVTRGNSTINVIYLPMQVTVAGHLTASCGNSYTYTATVGDGCAPFSYQWYYKEPGANTFALLSGETTSNLTLNAPAGNYEVRCEVVDCQGSPMAVVDDFSVTGSSMSASLTWEPNGPVDPGEDVDFEVSVTHGCSSLDYEWYYSEDGNNWDPLNGAVANEKVAAQNDNFKVKVIVSDSYGRSVETVSSWITVNP